MKIVVTGGAGFIGSAVVRQFIRETDVTVINVDKLTYAGDLESVAEVSGSPRYRYEKIDICDAPAMQRLFTEYRPDAVMHLAAESHVDRSIDGPGQFIQTNIIGTYTLLEAALAYWQGLHGETKAGFRFHHVSTDEVYGSWDTDGRSAEDAPYRPNSPYSASKAASDHLVRAWHHTYGMPVVITNCSNNYGPYHFPEKLIPLMIIKALRGEPLPLYGAGDNIRDWLYVEDHARALRLVLRDGKVGEVYNIAAGNELTNLQVVTTVCELLDEFIPESRYKPHSGLIRFVTDRPGHDRRYAIDTAKIRRELGWEPRETFESGLRKTVRWYIDQRPWWERIARKYQGDRLGLAFDDHAR